MMAARTKPEPPTALRTSAGSAISRRDGFSLLEVLLASGIALLLLSALYVGMDVQLRSTEEGRAIVDQSSLARNLLARMSRDLHGCLSPITAASATLLGAVTGTNVESVVGLTPTPLNMGLQGDSWQVTVYVSQVPKTGGDSGIDTNADTQPLGASDIHRITYWLAGGGLAKQDITRVTADDDSASLPPAVDDESKYILSEDVVGLQFRYFDGTNWTDSWDGATIGADGKTPIGPPRLIEITLTLKIAGTQNAEAKEKVYVHAVSIGAANAQPTTAGADATGGTSGTTSGGTTGGSE